MTCPLCGSHDYKTDEDGIITYCYQCGEEAIGYRPEAEEYYE